jgi:hypothetical protein
MSEKLTVESSSIRRERNRMARGTIVSVHGFANNQEQDKKEKQIMSEEELVKLGTTRKRTNGRLAKIRRKSRLRKEKQEQQQKTFVNAHTHTHTLKQHK